MSRTTPISSRLVAHHGEAAIYIAMPADQDTDICLLVYPDDGMRWAVACGLDGTTVTTSGASYAYTASQDGEPGDGTAISENVFVR